MKEKWYGVIAVLMGLMVLGTAAVPVLAQSEEEEATGVELTLRPALTIQAPRRAQVGEQVTMTVVERGTQEPVKDAAVWALTREDAVALKEEIAQLKEEGATPDEINHESLVSVRGIFLGTTHGNGELKYTFTEAGCYLLVAFKGGYIPGRTGIGIIPEALDL